MEERLVLILSRHVGFKLCHGTCVIINTPMIEDKWDKYGIHLQQTFIVDEWNDNKEQQEDCVKCENYVHVF